MGTNYYLHRNVCAHCGRGDEALHIGKSSAGWCFSLRVHPEEGIHDLPDWERELVGGKIQDEYGETFPPVELLRTWAERPVAPPNRSRYPLCRPRGRDVGSD